MPVKGSDSSIDSGGSQQSHRGFSAECLAYGNPGAYLKMIPRESWGILTVIIDPFLGVDQVRLDQSWESCDTQKKDSNFHSIFHRYHLVYLVYR